MRIPASTSTFPLMHGRNAISSKRLVEARPQTIRVRVTTPRIGPWLQWRSLAGYEWNSVELALPGLPPALEGMRILHLSDLHLHRTWSAEYDELIERVRIDPPDLLLFTGDFIENKRSYGPTLPLLQRMVTSLTSKHGKFAILGNHDPAPLAPRVQAWGMHVITHQRVNVPINGEPIELIGLPGLRRKDLDEEFLPSLPPKRPGVPRIVLAHYPDLIRTARSIRPDLYLAGHTHGGQVCFPGGRPVITHDHLPSSMSKGAHDVNGTCLVVNRGFGFTNFPLRLFCPAEVVEVKIVRLNH